MAALTYLIIPNANDQLSVSQGQIQTNFQSIMTLIDQDHTDFANTAPGKHFRVTLPVQSPAPSFSGGDIGLYSFLDPISNANQLYFSTTGGTQIPITAKGSAVINGITVNYSYFPSGQIVKWGKATTGAGGVVTIQLNGSGVPDTNAGTVVLSAGAGSASSALYWVTLQSISGSQFSALTFNSSQVATANLSFSWIVFGA